MKRDKMPISDRAKQFMPFAALRGYEEMVKRSEEKKEEKAELSEDRIEKLSKEINEIRKGDEVEVKYYRVDRYTVKRGMVAKIDFTFKTITVIKDVIEFNDIYEISKVVEGV